LHGAFLIGLEPGDGFGGRTGDVGIRGLREFAKMRAA